MITCHQSTPSSDTGIGMKIPPSEDRKAERRSERPTETDPQEEPMKVNHLQQGKS